MIDRKMLVGASAIAIAHSGVHAITDITGFGLMGHGREMALGSSVVLEIEVASVPTIPGALEAVRLGAIPAGLGADELPYGSEHRDGSHASALSVHRGYLARQDRVEGGK